MVVLGACHWLAAPTDGGKRRRPAASARQ